MVSIIMPCYNSQKYISASIKSVLAQSMSEWELLIINDASTDNTKRIIEKYSKKDQRIRVFHLKENSSAAVARNVGIEHAKYKYIAFLDSDDLWFKEKLSRQIDIMEKKAMPFSFSSYFIINHEGEIIELRKAPEVVTYNGLLNSGNQIGCLTVIYNKDIFTNYRFNENIRIHEDYKMWLDMFENLGIAYAIDEPLAMYRVHPGSKNLNKFRSLKWNWVLWRNYQKLSFLTSLLISTRWIINKIIQKYKLLFNTSHKSPSAYRSAAHKSVC